MNKYAVLTIYITIFGVAVVSWVREKERRLLREEKVEMEETRENEAETERGHGMTPERRLSATIEQRRISLDAHPVVLEVCVDGGLDEGANAEAKPRTSLPRIESGVEIGSVDKFE